MTNSGVTNPPRTDAELKQYEKEWLDRMIDFWREKMAQLKIIDTGRLYSSLVGSMTGADNMTLEHRFLLYGIYVERGTGYGYEHNNGGDLGFLEPGYRHETGLDKPRKRGPKWGGGYTSGDVRHKREWMERKYYYSVMRLNETLAAHYGEQYKGMVVSYLDTLFPDGKLTL